MILFPMLYGYIIFVVLPRKCTIPIISFLNKNSSILVVATCQCGQGCFAIGRVDMRYPLPWFPLSDGPSRYSCRTTRACRPYRSSHAGCRFGCSGSSRFAGGFRRLWLTNCVSVPRVRSCRDRCRYRYICRPGGLPARGGCRPKRSGFGFRGRSRLNYAEMTFLKFLRFSDDLDILLDLDPTYSC